VVSFQLAQTLKSLEFFLLHSQSVYTSAFGTGIAEMPRIWSGPSTEAEKDELTAIFRSMPTYVKTGDEEQISATATEVVTLCKALDYPLTLEQMDAYV